MNDLKEKFLKIKQCILSFVILHKIKIVFSTLLIVLLSFIIIQHFVNTKIQDYKIEVTQEHPNYESILTKDYWEYIIEIKEYDIKYGMSADLFDTMLIEGNYLIIDGKDLSYEDANRFLRALLNTNLPEGYESVVNYSTIIINQMSHIYTIVVISLELLILLVFVIKTSENKISMFTIGYWKFSKNEIKNIRKLCLMSIIFSCQVVAGFISLPSGFGNLGIGLSYLFQAVNCLLFGPVNGLILGAAGDLLGYVISPSAYGFFFPYTINAMLACFMYGLCFYKTRVTFVKVFISRIFINLFVNVFLGSIWWGIVAGLTYQQSLNYLLFISLPKNLFYLIPQSLLLFFVLKYTVKIFYRNNYIEEYQTKISLF